jgi:formylglycine-generating enzyme required for sulfatase activity
MILSCIPAGEFQMGSAADDPDAESDEYPQHTVYLDAYWMDQTEVTYGQFKRFMAAQNYDAYPCGEGDDHPVACVTWVDAKAYCEWAKRRLPTEAEWEKAARGGLEGKQYPWGNEAPVCTPGAANGAQFRDCGGRTVPVKTFSGNGYGLFDMAGNVWEWVFDWYDAYPGGDSSASDSFGETDRVLRGGSWSDDDRPLRAAYRVGAYPLVTYYYNGFRCARSP